MPQKCPKNKRSQITPPAKIRNRNHYNKGFWRVLFFQFESDYLHSKGHSLTRVSFFRFGSRINPPTLPHPLRCRGEGAGGRSRLSRFAPNPPYCNADAVEAKCLNHSALQGFLPELFLVEDCVNA